MKVFNFQLRGVHCTQIQDIPELKIKDIHETLNDTEFVDDVDIFQLQKSNRPSLEVKTLVTLQIMFFICIFVF